MGKKRSYELVRELPAFMPAGIEAFFTEPGRQKELIPPIMIEIARKYAITLLPKPGG